MDLDLKGKNAIVTGGTRGIGRAIAELLAAEGCNVALCARHEAAVDETVAALAGQGVKSWGGRIDVADTEALRAWVGEAAAALGGLDIFVANVSALAQSMDDDSWRRSLEIDIMGTVAGVEAAIPFLEQSTAGAIVVVGTTGAIEIAGPPRPYASAKAALVPYVKALARNLAAKNIRANMVSPGNVYFKGGVWNVLEESNPDAVSDDGRAQPDGPHGHAGRGRERRRVPREPARQLHHRHQPDRRRRADPASAVLTDVSPGSPAAVHPISFFSLSAICSGALSWVKLAVKRPSGSIT